MGSSSSALVRSPGRERVHRSELGDLEATADAEDGRGRVHSCYPRERERDGKAVVAEGKAAEGRRSLVAAHTVVVDKGRVVQENWIAELESEADGTPGGRATKAVEAEAMRIVVDPVTGSLLSAVHPV